MAQACGLLLESSICLSDTIQRRNTACTGALQTGLGLGHTMSHKIAFAEPV